MWKHLLVVVSVMSACGSESSSSPTPDREASLGEAFEMRVGESVRIESVDLILTFREVADDSRCPKDVTCVRAGEAFVRIVAELQGESTLLELEVPPGGGDEESFRGFSIQVLALEPQTESGRQIQSSEYVATVRVERD